MKGTISKALSDMLKYIPGLLLILVICIPAMAVQQWIVVNGKEVVSAVAVAILLGILIRNVLGVPQACRAGTSLAVKRVLRVGIALMGAQLSLMQVLQSGARSLIVIAICITAAILLVRGIGLRMGLSDRLGVLIGVGTSICGVSAIVATAPVIEAREEETSLAVGTITIFGLLALFVYPFLGKLLHMSNTFFGTWAGTAVNDTSQVVATGLIYSQKAGEVATVVKLTRNLFMAPVIVILSSAHVMRRDGTGRAADGGKGTGAGSKWKTLRTAFPVFVLGFLGMAVLNSLGAFTPALRQGVGEASRFLILVAIAGVGLETNIASMRRIGLRPFYAGLCAAVLMAGVSYGLITMFGIG
jgi:uncharacterized integral membrane protein (TIGR00698 family)